MMMMMMTNMMMMIEVLSMNVMTIITVMWLLLMMMNQMSRMLWDVYDVVMRSYGVAAAAHQLGHLGVDGVRFVRQCIHQIKNRLSVFLFETFTFFHIDVGYWGVWISQFVLAV